MNNEVVAIIMATYNGEKYISEQIQSLLCQTYPNFNLYIQDDCSTDSTFSILSEFQQNDKRIHLFQNKSNVGYKKNFEFLLQRTSEHFILFCDQDDIWVPEHIEILLNNINDNDCIGGNALLIDTDGNSMNITTKDCCNINIIPSKENQFIHLLFSNNIQGAAMMITSNIKKSMLPIPDNIKWHDYWAAQIASVNNGCKYIDNVILKYRKHSVSVTRTENYSIFNRIKTYLKNKNEIYNDTQDKIDLLIELDKRCIDVNKSKIIKQAIKYHKNILSNNNIYNLHFYCKHYKQIYLNTKISLFIIRFIRTLFF